MDPSLHKNPELKIESFPDIPLPPHLKRLNESNSKLSFSPTVLTPLKNLFILFIDTLASEEMLHVVHNRKVMRSKEEIF